MDIDRSLAAFRALILFSIGLPGCVDGEKTIAACDDSTAILDGSGAATGYERCADGTIHRVSAVAATPTISGETCLGTEEYLSCTTDADCTTSGTPGTTARCLHQEYVELGGRMVPVADTGAPPQDGCFCAYSCETDADCGTGYACIPNEVVTKGQAWSTCEPADCATDADCTSGECGLTSHDNGCGYEVNLVCREGSDTCRLDEECTDEGGVCAPEYGDDTYACRTTTCVIGRPLEVEGRARVADAAPRSDWSAGSTSDLDELDAGLRAELAAWWTEVAALEHASVGSFARFTLELLALGAPPELLASTQQAASDEIEHARVCYGLASRYGGAPVGPGPLSLDRVSLCADPAAILVSLIREACVGETLGAAEARACAAEAADPELRRLLSRIAADEERHAALAWRSLRWMLERDPSLADLARSTFDEATRATAAAEPSPSPDAPHHGVLGPAARSEIHRAALERVVRPCAEALTG